MARDAFAVILASLPYWSDGLRTIDEAVKSRTVEHSEDADSLFEILHLENGDLQKVATASPASSQSNRPLDDWESFSSSNASSKRSSQPGATFEYDSGAQVFLEHLIMDLSRARTLMRQTSTRSRSEVASISSQEEDEDEVDMAELLRNVRKRKSVGAADELDFDSISSRMQLIQDLVTDVALDLVRSGGQYTSIGKVLAEIEQLRTLVICEEARQDAKCYLNVG